MSQRWQSYPALRITPPAKLMPWLLDPKSFMQRLRQHQVQGATVRVLNQHWQFPSQSERSLLGLQPRQYGLIREVLISSPSGKWMFARTVLPRATLTGNEQLLARLKDRALGSVLFNRVNVTRGPFEFSVVKQNSPWHKKITAAAALDEPEFWARRSVFLINHKTLLLSEVFFPDLMEL